MFMDNSVYFFLIILGKLYSVFFVYFVYALLKPPLKSDGLDCGNARDCARIII